MPFTRKLATMAIERHVSLARDYVLYGHGALGINRTKMSEKLSRFVAQETFCSLFFRLALTQLSMGRGSHDAQIEAAGKLSRVAIKGGQWYSWGEHDKETDLVIVVSFDFLGERPWVATVCFVPTSRLQHLVVGKDKPEFRVFFDAALVAVEADLAAPLPPNGRQPIKFLTGGRGAVKELRTLLS